MSGFIENIKEKLKEKGLSESSIKLYLRNLRILNNDKDIEDVNFLKDKKDIIKKIDEKKPNTQRAYLISIVSILKALDQSILIKHLLKFYTELMLKKADEIKQSNTGEKTESQKENWMEWDEVKQKHQDLFNQVKNYSKKKKLTKEEYDNLLKFVVLSLYVEIPPRRNDYQQMKIKTKKEEDPKYNYLDIENKNFIFNNFKTAKIEGQKKITIPDNLYKIIQFYLKFKPENKEDYFLVNHKGDKLNSINGITRILNTIFNKNIGSSLLRHFYLSSKYSHIKEEQSKDAELMSHSTKTQDEQYIKKK